MITVISEAKKIEKLHKLFHEKLYEIFTKKIYCRVGYPGGSFEDNVHYSPELDLWLGGRKIGEKFWNGFGYGRPNERGSNSITGEINFPFQGINRRIGGVFAVEDNGNILVLHRGKIGGGKAGIGKNLFMDKFAGDKVICIDGDRETDFCLIGELNSSYLPKQVKTFISEMKRIKSLDLSKDKGNFEDLNNFPFTSEHSGQSTVERSGSSVINRTHGIVVEALFNELQKKGYEIGNDLNRDLFIHESKKIKVLFEVKTNSFTQSLYSAVGQLIVYSIPIRNKIGLVAVLPQKLSPVVEQRLKTYGINVMYYKWIDGDPEFENLDAIIYDSMVK